MFIRRVKGGYLTALKTEHICLGTAVDSPASCQSFLLRKAAFHYCCQQRYEAKGYY